MKRLVTATLACHLVLASAAFADDPLACLDPAVTATLLAKPRLGPYEVTREWPTHFPAIALPAEFELIGTRTSPHTSAVAFATGLPQSEASAKLTAALEQDGWTRKDETAGQQRGFQLPKSEANPEWARFCKPLEDAAEIVFFPAADGRTYLTLKIQAGLTGGCESQDLPGVRMFSAAEIPLLQLPAGDYGYAAGTFFDTEDRVLSTAELQSRRSGTDLLEHFGRQLAEQHWRPEAQWSAPQLHGSAWLSPDASMSAFLTVLEQGDGRYALQLRASNLR